MLEIEGSCCTLLPDSLYSTNEIERGTKDCLYLRSGAVNHRNGEIPRTSTRYRARI